MESKGYYYNVHLKDFKKGCDELLKQYILSINPIYLPKRYFKKYKPISYYLNRNMIAIDDEISTDYILNRLMNFGMNLNLINSLHMMML